MSTMISYSTNQASVSNGNQATDQAIFEADKRAVYKHPLFPLLALIFERCEQATQWAEMNNSEVFNMDIQAFVQHQEKNKRPFLINDAEVDRLMIKAIQVLRIHLLELEKVQELCKDFCIRYITCLKSKMQSENLLKPDHTQSYSENNSSSGHSSDSNSSLTYSPCPYQVVSGIVPSKQILKEKLINTSYSQTSSIEMSGLVAAANAIPNQLLSVNCSSVTESTHSNSSSSPGIILGSTPLSQISVNSVPAINDINTLDEALSPVSDTSCDETENHYEIRRKQKRGVLPKYATTIMRSWLFQHLVHPYPTEDEKKQIATQTNLTLLQINNWFINARRRILQPMLDASTTNKKGASAIPSNDSDLECSDNEIRITEKIQQYSEEDTDP